MQNSKEGKRGNETKKENRRIQGKRQKKRGKEGKERGKVVLNYRG